MPQLNAASMLMQLAVLSGWSLIWGCTLMQTVKLLLMYLVCHWIFVTCLPRVDNVCHKCFTRKSCVDCKGGFIAVAAQKV